MSGQASSPNGSFTNVAAGCSLRESRSAPNSSSSSSNINNAPNSTLVHSQTGLNNNRGGMPPFPEGSINPNGNDSGHGISNHRRPSNVHSGNGSTHGGGEEGSGGGQLSSNPPAAAAGISSSSTSRSAARFIAAASASAAAEYDNDNRHHNLAHRGGQGSGPISHLYGMGNGVSINYQQPSNNNYYGTRRCLDGGNSSSQYASLSSSSHQSAGVMYDPVSYLRHDSNSVIHRDGLSFRSADSQLELQQLELEQQQQQQQQLQPYNPLSATHQPPHHTNYSYLSELAVYSWGRGEDGQLGIGDTSDQDEPTYVDALRGVGVKQIACGSGHTVVLTGDGEVYTWGRGDDGRLGHGDNGWKYVPRLTHSLTGQIITHVTCGSYHTAAVSSNGDLYTWGGGMYGKLGHGNESGHSTPKRVEALFGLTIVDIACGSRHTAVVTNKGCLYTWGDKENGVAGHGDTEGYQYTPKLLERLSGKKVVQLSACGFHTGCLTDQGEVYTWGEGKFGRLGHGQERNCHSPRLVESLLGKRPRQIACGGFHSAVITHDGKMYTFGGGEHGQLGHGDKVNKVKPTLVQALDGVVLQQITCGWSHSVALTAEGEVYTWGNGDHGKLGHGSGKKVSTPQLVEKLVGLNVVCIASYNEHTAALVEPHSATDGGFRRHSSTMVPISSGFLHDMKDMVNDEEYSDVTFIVEDQPVYALRAILAKRCEHFAAMFRSGMRESEAGAEIPIPNLSRAVFLLILEYLYTDSVKIELEHAVELYIASDLYQISTLRDMCCVVVRRSIGSENVTYLLQSADEAHCQVIKDIAMEYIIANFDVISKTEGIKVVSHGLLLEILSMRP
eukprot:CAMPEP_0171399114 /NCGR_PEP_ID=MMETSP0880-20121228/6388_1 /TAXON_ID=67004 /ORGANISM="Thalassiosira weissflogii, Strain CCMP1336" /LENGTH=839 /DNA_ID=CAMNT_0011913219 /DNA_START=41 /DNA_END=2560 /DNA_ORIENTATION=-